jgi:hypothetical protein
MTSFLYRSNEGVFPPFFVAIKVEEFILGRFFYELKPPFFNFS